METFIKDVKVLNRGICKKLGNLETVILPENLISKKILKAKTDSLPFPENEKDLEGRPEINNLLNIFMAIEDVSLPNLIQSYAGMEFKKFKEDLGDCLVSKLSKISSEMRRLLSDNQYLDSILSEGSMNAQEIARKNISDIKKLIGFYKS